MFALLFAFAMGSDADPSESFGAVDLARERPEPLAEQDVDRRNFVVVNTPGVLVGRLGFDFGTMIAAHVAPMASAHAHITYLPVGGSRESLFGFGGELGARLFTSAWRPAGAFGGAVDLGWSAVTKSGLVVSVGGGAEYRLVKSDGTGGRGEVANLFVSAGLRPRGLVQIGKAF